MVSPRLTMRPLLVQSRLAITSTVAFLTWPLDLRTTGSGSDGGGWLCSFSPATAGGFSGVVAVGVSSFGGFEAGDETTGSGLVGSTATFLMGGPATLGPASLAPEPTAVPAEDSNSIRATSPLYIWARLPCRSEPVFNITTNWSSA